jgi:two-component system CheB/CheR fusion protein
MAVQESETLRRLAVVVRDSRDAITVQDSDGRILAWNPGAERLYGWSEAEALTMNISDLVPKDRLDEELAIVKRLGLSEVLEPLPARRLAKDGRTVTVWLTSTALVDEAGHLYAIATTERKQDGSGA